jgi:hypothetical protein
VFAAFGRPQLLAHGYCELCSPWSTSLAGEVGTMLSHPTHLSLRFQCLQHRRCPCHLMRALLTSARLRVRTLLMARTVSVPFDASLAHIGASLCPHPIVQCLWHRRCPCHLMRVLRTSVWLCVRTLLQTKCFNAHGTDGVRAI